MGLLIDQLAYSNKLIKVHPGEKFAFAILTMIIVLFFSQPVLSLLVCVLMSICTVVKAGINVKVYLRLLLWPMAFLLPGVLGLGMVLQKDPEGLLIVFFSFYSYQIGITQGSIEQVISVLGRSLASLCCMYFLILTTPMTEQLGMLRKLKVPEMVVELMGLIYRLITILLGTAMTIHVSQKARLGYRDLKQSFLSLGRLLSAIFTQGFFKLQKMNLALESRCYRGELLFLEPDYYSSRKNILGIITVETVLIVLGLYLGG